MAVEGTIPGTRTKDASAGAAVASGGKSTAMWLMPIAALIEALITINVMLSIGFMPPLVVFLVILGAIAVLGFARPGPRVFLIGGIVLAVFIAMNLPFAIDGLIHPIGTNHAWTDIIAIVVGATGAIAGFAAFAELRRDKPAVRAFRAPIGEALAILFVGVLVGASYVSISGFSTLEGTPGLGVANGVITAPAQAPVELDAVYVVNADAGPHIVRHRAERPPSFLPCPGPFHGGGRAEPGGGRHLHLLVRHSGTPLDDGRDAGGDPVTTTRGGAVAARARGRDA